MPRRRRHTESIFRAPPIPDGLLIALKPAHVEQLRDGVIRLRYAVGSQEAS